MPADDAHAHGRQTNRPQTTFNTPCNPQRAVEFASDDVTEDIFHAKHAAIGRGDTLCPSDMADLQSRLMRTVGEPAFGETRLGENKHTREADADDIRSFVASSPAVHINIFDSEPYYADLVGVPTEEGHAPVLLTAPERMPGRAAAEMFHVFFHVAEAVGDRESDHEIVTDGGEEWSGTLLHDDPEEMRWVVGTQDVGEFLGVDGEDYEVYDGERAEVPADNAQILVERGAAEPAPEVGGGSVGDTDGDGGEVGGSDEGEEASDSGGGGLLAAAMGDEDAQAETGLEPSDDSPVTQSPSTPGGSGSNATGSTRATSMLPLNALASLEDEELRRHARKRGLDIPSTQEVRDRTDEAIKQAILNNDKTVVNVPTGGGKTYAVHSTNWGARSELTDGKQVVVFHSTREARDQAAEVARETPGDVFVMRARDELCPMAAGHHDPDGKERTVTYDGTPASEYIRKQCDGKGIPYSTVHKRLVGDNDQGIKPDCACNGPCPSQHQHEVWRDEDPALTVATDNFAHVPGLRYDRIVIQDEMPSYVKDLSDSRIRDAVNAYLREVGAPISTLGALVRAVRTDTFHKHLVDALERTRERVKDRPSREWYMDTPEAHMLAPGIINAVLNADSDDTPGEWLHGKTGHEPQRLDANAKQDEFWNVEWVGVTINPDDEVVRVRATPDFNQSAAVIGLDAHPEMSQWRLNTWPNLDEKKVLRDTERALWRRFERGLEVVQVGEHERPLTSGDYYDSRGARAVMEQLRDAYGDGFRTAITSNAVETDLRLDMESAGVENPQTMHMGNVKSRNDFAHEPAGYVEGCIDPGDGFVMATLAEVGAEAVPERADVCCENCGDRQAEPEEPGPGCPDCNGTGMAREHGRAFVGDDADIAAAILDSVREAEVAQSVGRWARDADDPADTATVFVRTSVLPDHMVDQTVPGVTWTYGDKQRRVVEYLREQDSAVTAREVADACDCSKDTVHDTARRLEDRGYVESHAGAGKYGATLYDEDDNTPPPTDGVSDLGQIGEHHVYDPPYEGFAVSLTLDTGGDEGENTPGTPSVAGEETSESSGGGVLDWGPPG